MDNLNTFFNDTYFCVKILINSTKLRDKLENDETKEISLTSDLNEINKIKENYKQKLRCIYRIRNNAYSFLLQNGFNCTYKIDENNNTKTFYMNIEGIIYDCKESAVKNILGENYENIINKCISEENIKLFNDVLEKEKQEKQIEQNNKKQGNKEKINENEKSASLNTNEILNNFETISNLIDIDKYKINNKNENFNNEKIDEFKLETNEKPLKIEPTNEKVIDLNDFNEENKKVFEENPKIVNKQKETKRCPLCFAPLNNNQTTCDFCGYDLRKEEITPYNELKLEEDEEEFSEEDIDKMFAELEECVNSINNVNENSNNTINKYIDLDDMETVRLYNPEKSEISKKRSEMIMDIYTLKLKDPAAQEKEAKKIEDNRRKRLNEEIEDIEESSEDEIIREIKIYVYPLSVPENGNEISSEILVYITQDGNCGTFCSGLEGINSVKVNTNIHNFIVRGQWKNGNFETKLIGNGKTLTEGLELERIKEEIRPDDIISAKLGHPITFLTIEYVDGTETLKIHAVPISEDNENDGFAKTLYLMENVNLKERKLFITKSSNFITFEFEEEIYKATAKWVDDTFKMKVENY